MGVQFGNTSVNIKSLVRSGWLETEMRLKVSDQKVWQYAEEKRFGAEFPRPRVFFDTKEQKYWVGDGFHRILAEKENGAKTVEVELVKGSKRDAFLFCIENNRDQRGLPYPKSRARSTHATDAPAIVSPGTRRYGLDLWCGQPDRRILRHATRRK